MLKLCFTINKMRTLEEIRSYKEVLDLAYGIEIFYPYDEDDKQYSNYILGIKELLLIKPSLEVVLHLPHGLHNSISSIEDLRSGSLNIMFDAINFGTMFNARKLTLHLGRLSSEVSRSESIKQAALSLSKLCDYAKKFNMMVMIENMPSILELGYSPYEIREIIDTTNKDNLFFIYDTGHANVSEYDNLSYLDILKDKLLHIHYSNNFGIKDTHSKLLDGNIDFLEHFKKLHSINYNNLHCAEIIYNDVIDLLNNLNDLNRIGRLYENNN